MLLNVFYLGVNITILCFLLAFQKRRIAYRRTNTVLPWDSSSEPVPAAAEESVKAFL